MISRAYVVFLAVARCGSFSRAARELYLSQPAVSRQIHVLETELGYPLFDREGGATRLTSAGRSLKNDLEGIKPLCDKAMRSAQSAAQGHLRELAFGYGPVYSSLWLLRALSAFSSKVQPVGIQLVSDRDSRLHERLLLGELDVILTLEADIYSESIIFRPTCEAVPCVYFRQDHPFQGEDRLDPARLAREESLIFSSFGWSRQYLLIIGELTACGFSVSNIKVADCPENGLLYAAMGMGAYVAGDIIAARAEELGLSMKTIEVKGSRLDNIAVGLAYTSKALAPLVETFAECIVESRRSA